MKKLIMAAALAAVSAPTLSYAQAVESAPAQAQAAAARPDADPALWVVRDEDTTIYLFGTFHMLDGSRDWFNDEVREAFDRSDELVLEFNDELDAATVQPLVQRYAVDPNGRTLSQRLPAEVTARLDAELVERGYPAGALEAYEPWFATMTLVSLSAQQLGFTGEHGPETALTAAARARNIPIGGVETLESQMQMLDGVPEETQIEQLVQTIATIDDAGETFAAMHDAWSTGDEAALFAIVTRSTGTDSPTYKAYLVDRNARWTDWLAERMARPGTVFVAVGAAHLVGPDSVQAMLARRGHSSLRVPS